MFASESCDLHWLSKTVTVIHICDIFSAKRLNNREWTPDVVVSAFSSFSSCWPRWLWGARRQSSVSWIAAGGICMTERVSCYLADAFRCSASGTPGQSGRLSLGRRSGGSKEMTGHYSNIHFSAIAVRGPRLQKQTGFLLRWGTHGNPANGGGFTAMSCNAALQSVGWGFH